ncbi:MAG: nitroreductase family protein [Thermomicrobiales bacterium]
MSNNADVVFDNMRTRRAVRSFSDEPVSVADIRRIIEAARWASSAGNRRLHRFYVTRDPAKIDLISAVGPGFYGHPPALIVICTDLEKAAGSGVKDGRDESTWIDVGTAAMNMQLMAHALGLGTTPVTSVSRSGLIEALELPEHLRPELILQLGHPAPSAVPGFGSGQRIRPEDLTDWERVGGQMPATGD